ncbi:MAG: hypothetical protein RRZ33_04945 [Lachnospiraceae bacterium]
MEDIEIVYERDTGFGTERSPVQVNAQSYVTNLLYQIAIQEPYKLTVYELAQQLSLDLEMVKKRLSAMEQIGEIHCRGGSYRLCFPVFLRNDVQKITVLLKKKTPEIGENIVKLLDQIRPFCEQLSCRQVFSERRLLYHILCDEVLLGFAHDFWEKTPLFTTSRYGRKQRNRLLVGYERSNILAGHSNQMICKQQHYSGKKITYISFGDSNGRRKDMCSLYEQRKEDSHTLYEMCSPIVGDLLTRKTWEEVMDQCDSLLERIIFSKQPVLLEKDDEEIVEFLAELGYITKPAYGRPIYVKVPVFFPEEEQLIQKIGEELLMGIQTQVNQLMEAVFFQIPELTAIRHKVQEKHIGYELWRLLVGEINQYLVERGVVEKPIFRDQEGRFLQSIYFN